MSKRDPLTSSVVACRWQRVEDAWRLWVKGRPEVTAEAPTFAEAQQALIEAIWSAAPNMDAIDPVAPEFDPPIPPLAALEPYLVPELFEISGQEAFELCGPTRPIERLTAPERLLFDALFQGGICPHCHRGRGPRSAATLQMRYVPPRTDAGFVGASFGVDIHLFSERFLAMLTADERRRLDFQPVELPAGTRRRFFELRGCPDVVHVGVRTMDSDGFACAACGYRTVAAVEPRMMEEGREVWRFVCRQDLPDPLPTCLTVGWQDSVTLVMTRARCAELHSQPGWRGIRTARLGVVGEEACDRNPRVRSALYHCERCSEWPQPCTLDDKHQACYELPARMCSQRNFAWLDRAAEAGYLQYSRQTLTPLEIWDLVARGVRPRQTEFTTFRCPTCWRLGQIVLTRRDLSLSW
ncbi:MAG TPA: hypothetical protein P5572_05775 [Phycisphaerae bacterium]|nr:hypothetical protein [Phycisphaerales bacterium]HRX84511.1 hypothetical protein [Phycisphaerae bacterium]